MRRKPEPCHSDRDHPSFVSRKNNPVLPRKEGVQTLGSPASKQNSALQGHTHTWDSRGPVCHLPADTARGVACIEPVIVSIVTQVREEGIRSWQAGSLGGGGDGGEWW